MYHAPPKHLAPLGAFPLEGRKATLDNRTSDACQELDGKVIAVSKAVVGLNYPPLHPYCRSTTIPYFEDLEGSRIARAEDGIIYRVPGDMTFEARQQQLADDTLVKVAEVDTLQAPEGVAPFEAGEPEEEEPEPQEELTDEADSDKVELKEKQMREFEELISQFPHMTEEYKELLLRQFGEGSENARTAFLKYVTSDVIGNSSFQGTDHYNSRENKVFMNFAGDFMNRFGLGQGAIFWHEFGHFIDFNAQSGSSFLTSMQGEGLANALKADVANLQAWARSLGARNRNAQVEVFRKLVWQYSQEETAVVSDALESILRIDRPLGIGHGAAYWKEAAAEIEVFAGIFEAQFNNVKLELCEELLPLATAEFNLLLGGIVNTCKNFDFGSGLLPISCAMPYA